MENNNENANEQAQPGQSSSDPEIDSQRQMTKGLTTYNQKCLCWKL